MNPYFADITKLPSYGDKHKITKIDRFPDALRLHTPHGTALLYDHAAALGKLIRPGDLIARIDEKSAEWSQADDKNASAQVPLFQWDVLCVGL